MKLQLAVDLLTIDETRRLLDEIGDLIDIVEIGTPLIMREGVKAVSAIKKTHPDLTVLADLKIVDAGEHEAQIGFEAGADIVTVLGLAHQATILGALHQANRYQRQLMIDLISVNDIQQRAAALDALGCHYICVHTASDRQAHGENPLADLGLVGAAVKQAKLAVAGGIKPATLPQIVAHKPDIIIVGSYITSHPNQRQAATEIRKHLNRE